MTYRDIRGCSAYIGEVRVYDRVLTAADVRERYLSTWQKDPSSPTSPSFLHRSIDSCRLTGDDGSLSDRYGACPAIEIGTAAACTAPAADPTRACAAACSVSLPFRCLSTLRFHVADCALFLCRPLTDERCDHCLSSSFTDFHRGSAAAIASLAVLFAVDAACQPWARGRGLPVDTQWATLAGDHSLGLSVDNLQYDAEEGKGSFLFDNAIDPVALNISPSA